MRPAAPPLLLLLALLVAPGCAGERPRQQPSSSDPARPGEVRAPSTEELKRLRRTSEAIVVGQVGRREEGPTGVTYAVRVVEVLHASPTLGERAASHPCAVDAELAVGDFLFRDGSGGQGGTIGPLRELSRYVLFLSPAEADGRWLNLEDAAGYPLPEAQATLDALRALRDGRPADAGPAAPRR